MDRASHYVRVAQRLALASSVGLLTVGCAMVVGGDDASSDGPVVVDDHVPTSADALSTTPVPCDPTNPGSLERQPCASIGVTCGMSSCGSAVCQQPDAADVPRWNIRLCTGPLPPPELA